MDSLKLALAFSACAIGGFFVTPWLFVAAAVFGVLYVISFATFLWRWPFE
ncbi:MAG TPA: hypothetical protein PJ986_10550 [Gammaproteobacteria bacterium]|nr:hypothetical protein [Gammaproteobacteria bacterium]